MYDGLDKRTIPCNGKTKTIIIPLSQLGACNPTNDVVDSMEIREVIYLQEVYLAQCNMRG